MNIEQQTAFISEVTIGTEIQSPYMTMVVTEITKKGFVGYDKKWFMKSGKKEECMLLFSTIANVHYNKDLKIIN